MTGPPTVDIHGDNRLTAGHRVRNFPPAFQHFSENINILRQTSSTWHRILTPGVLRFGKLSKRKHPVAPEMFVGGVDIKVLKNGEAVP